MGSGGIMSYTRPPESLPRWTSANHSPHPSEDALPPTPHVIHLKIFSILFIHKLNYTYQSALSPAILVPVKQATKPKSHLLIFIVLCALKYMTSLSYFLKSNSTSPSEFHFGMLVLLLFLYYSCFPSSS